MREISVQLPRLFNHSMLFLALGVIVTVVMIILFRGHWSLLLKPEVHLHGMRLALFGVIAITLPLLIIQFCFHLTRLIAIGRLPGVPLLSYQTLYNPINLLFRRSLLNAEGKASRRRCLIAIILLTLQMMLLSLVSIPI